MVVAEIEEVRDLNRDMLEALRGTELYFERASTVNKDLFGSVSVNDVKDFFAKKAVEAAKIDLEGGVIKTLGRHKIVVDGIDFEINVVEPPSIAKQQQQQA